jgi:polyhydroxyalkanoate synthesis regulator phasin
MAASQPTYVYGVRAADTKRLGSAKGIGDADLHEVAHDGLAALVSEMPDDRELRFGRDELAAHARVLEQAIELVTILPMRFGVVMENADDVRTRLLEAHHDELIAQLREFDGKVELRVRAIYDETQLMREIVRADERIQRLRERVRTLPDDATYFDRIQLGELIVEAIDHKRSVDAEDVLKPLAPLANEIRVGEPTHERMVVSASFLVDRARMADFDQAVDKVGQAQAQRMRLKYTGPLPPYSFAELTGAGAAATEA